MPEVINPTIITPETTPAPSTSSLAATIQPTVQNVYSTANVSQAMTTPKLKPDLNDPLGMKATIEQNLGLNTLRETERNLTAQLTSLRGTGRAQQEAIKNLPQALNVIRGEQAVSRETQALSEQALSEQVGIAQTARLAAEQQAMEQFNILNTERTNKLSLATQYPGAKISVYDDYGTITKKIAKYNEQQAKDTYKAELKSAAMKLGLSTSGSTKQLEQRLSQEYQGQAAIQKAKDAASLAATRAGTAKTLAELSSVKSNTALANAQSALLASRGADGKVDPQVYIRERENYLRNVSGATPQTFDTQFGTLLSPDEQENLGVSTAATRAVSTGKVRMTQGQIEDNATMTVLKNYADELVQKPSLAGVGGLGYGTAASFLAKNLGVGSAEGQQNRNLIGNIQGTIAKLRGGTSFTPNEQRLLETYTPTVNDSEMVIKQKLTDLSRFINDKQNAMQAISGQNYGGTTPSLQQQVEELRNAGYSEEQINVLLSQ